MNASPEKFRGTQVKHGMAATRRQDYDRWRAMIRRCENPDDPNWPRYGGRGIQVCERWHDPVLFVQDLDALGPKPSGATLDRKDNDGNYEPGNVQWSTWSRQTRNQERWKNGSALFLPAKGVWVSKLQLGTFGSAQEAGEAYLRAVEVLTGAGILT